MKTLISAFLLVSFSAWAQNYSPSGNAGVPASTNVPASSGNVFSPGSVPLNNSAQTSFPQDNSQALQQQMNTAPTGIPENQEDNSLIVSPNANPIPQAQEDIPGALNPSQSTAPGSGSGSSLPPHSGGSIPFDTFPEDNK